MKQIQIAPLHEQRFKPKAIPPEKNRAADAFLCGMACRRRG